MNFNLCIQMCLQFALSTPHGHVTKSLLSYNHNAATPRSQH